MKFAPYPVAAWLVIIASEAMIEHPVGLAANAPTLFVVTIPTGAAFTPLSLSRLHISDPTRLRLTPYSGFCWNQKTPLQTYFTLSDPFCST